MTPAKAGLFKYLTVSYNAKHTPIDNARHLINSEPDLSPALKTAKPSGAQSSHLGKTLQKIDDLGEIEILSIDRRTLPKGKYHQQGNKTRQFFDIDSSRIVTVYRAGCWKMRWVNVPLPSSRRVSLRRYSTAIKIKAHAVYLS
jgi:hypothetical protein